MNPPPIPKRILIKPDNTVLTDWENADLEEGCLFQHGPGEGIRKCKGPIEGNGLFSWQITTDDEDIRRVQTIRLLMS